MDNIKKLNINKYKLIIFDWDGTLIDSIPAYKTWDKLYVKTFYNVDLPVEYFEDLANKIKTNNPGHSENEYFRYLDKKFGNDNTPMEEIWKNIYTVAPDIQSKIQYKKHVPEVLKKLKLASKANITLATNSRQRDIAFFSSKKSLIAKQISPIDYFDKIITLDDIDNPKPNPESFQKLIDYYSVNTKEVLVFEDSLHGIMAAKNAGVDTVFLNNDVFSCSELANYSINSWQEMVEILN